MTSAAPPATLRQRLRRWATRTETPERQPVTLRQSRVYVLPTATGGGVLGTLLLMFIAAINYNLSLGFALTFFLGSVMVVHILHSWRTLTSLSISLQAHGEAYAGGNACWMMTLTNAQDSARPAVRILDSDGEECLCVDLPAQTTLTRPINLPCPRRGRMQPGSLTVETRQPLGWIRAWAYIEPHAPVIVFPAPAGTLPLPAAFGAASDSSHGMAPGQDDFAGLRGFHPGDSLRHVAWKQLARGQGMLTKLYASGQATSCVFDWHGIPPNLPLEARLSQLTQWVLAARQAGLRTTLILPSQQVGPGQDAAHHLECLTRLALFAPEARHG